MLISQKDNYSTVKDSKSQNILLKGHKLAAATYLVTKFLPNNEALKWRLRSLSLKIVSDADPDNLSAVLKPLDQITSLIEIALSSRSVSLMNFSILQQEYLSLRSLINSEQAKHNPLQRIPTPQIYPAAPELIRPVAPSSPLANRLGGLSALPQQRTKTPVPSPHTGASNQRRDSILKFIKETGWSSIREIAKAVPDFSSKTVQRELVDMVRLGILKKEGDRRWSRYQVANVA
ncbi:MAG: hypothetical protein U9M92_01920 [Patescibacteria group bacterium]|nr:hypothetical protein [Patescibacteria group bacterium]